MGMPFAVFFIREERIYALRSTVVASMSSRPDQPQPFAAASSDSVPDILIRGADMLDRAQRICRAIERRAQDALGPTGSHADREHAGETRCDAGEAW
jgi:hypothetical protein